MVETPPKQDQQKADSVDGFIRAFRALLVVLVGALIGYFVWANTVSPDARYPFKLGLDLAGGSHLVYEADVSGIEPQEVPELMGVLREVIERRINVFGVSEPIVRVESSSIVSNTQSERLVVELPGVTDVEQAVAEIGRTPLLEFKLIDEEALAIQETIESFEQTQLGTSTNGTSSGAIISNVRVNGATTTDPYLDTGLTGRYLETASLQFAGGQSGQLANEPIVSVRFNSEGAELFESITRANVGARLAIFLDGELISAPRINEAIPGGTAIISGGFNPDEARALAQNLSFGALPVAIELVSTQTIGATLGAEVLDKGITAGLVGITFVLTFMLLWYRLPGIVAGVALVMYVTIMLALFKLIPVTLTAAGLAGLILSVGMAVDANVLVFERMKEEYRNGKSSREAARAGFTRAWSAIRDGNITSLLSAIILFWFGTSLVKGFALVFGIGVIISMLSALFVTRTLLIALPEVSKDSPSLLARLFNSGFTK